MKNQLQTIKAVAIFTFATLGIKAQTTADMQNLTLTPNSYWNGSTSNPTVTTAGTFTSGNCIFPNKYEGNFGGYWDKGWSYSNMKDSTTVGFANQYSARWAEGYSASTIYTIAKGSSKLKFNAIAQGKQMGGFYINNTTFAAISMRDGDNFGKKFGGASSNDPDWFKLKVQKYINGNLALDSVTFYLADFRDVNNANDYVVKNWRYVDLKSLGNADSLLFSLTSSDVGSFGMNTPSYFALDDFTTLDVANSISTQTINSINCAAAVVTVNFNITGVFTPSNVFTTQLSNANGSFASAVTIGTITGTGSVTQVVNAIPANTQSGSGYKIRVNSSSPLIIGIANSNSFTVNNCTSINELETLYNISAFPNPTTKNATVSFNSQNDNVLFLNIFDVMGKLVLSKNIKSIIGNNSIDIEMETFELGIYMIKLSNANLTKHIKLIKY